MSDDERQPHEEKADELDRKLDELQEQSDQLGADIEGAGEDWERRKADDRVPGATGEPSEDDDDDDVEGDGEELDFGRSLAEDGSEDEGEGG
jgi:hypothetical protein